MTMIDESTIQIPDMALTSYVMCVGDKDAYCFLNFITACVAWTLDFYLALKDIILEFKKKGHAGELQRS